MNSPFFKDKPAILEQEISSQFLIDGYQKSFGINICDYLKGVDKIYQYKCSITGYRFYYPFHISGDSKFYQKLQLLEWYYMPWKWENEETLKLLKGDENILEVGSGGLGFIETLHNKGFNITGLELNEDSVKKAAEKKLKVFPEIIQNFKDTNREIFDICCSFQVLEHISEVDSFIKSQIECLKKDGRLIISVPNNETFIKWDKEGYLNKPPHHMGLWDSESLKNLEKIYGLKVEKILYEPLQEYHIGWYLDILIKSKIEVHKVLYKIFQKYNLSSYLFRFIQKFRKRIHGHTVMFVFRKL